MNADFHVVDLLLTVPNGLIDVDGQPFSYRRLRDYLESLGWRDVFTEAGRFIGIITMRIDAETLSERIQSFLRPSDRFELLDTSGLELPMTGAESQWLQLQFPERLP